MSILFTLKNEKLNYLLFVAGLFLICGLTVLMTTLIPQNFGHSLYYAFSMIMISLFLMIVGYEKSSKEKEYKVYDVPSNITQK